MVAQKKKPQKKKPKAVPGAEDAERSVEGDEGGGGGQAPSALSNSLLVAVDLGTDSKGKITSIGLVAINKNSRSNAGEAEVLVDEAKGGLKAAVGEVEGILSNWGGRIGFVCDGGRLIRKEVPALRKRNELPAGLGGHWERYHDIGREVERSTQSKCSGFIALMAAVGLDPVTPSSGMEKADCVAEIILKLLESGNAFKRPMQAQASGDTPKDPKKKKRKREEAEEEEEEAKQEPHVPPPDPSMHLLRDTLFLSGAAGAIRGSLAAFAEGVKGFVQKEGQAVLGTGSTYAGSPEWASVAACHAIDVLADAGSAVLVCVPSLSCALEAVAALADLGNRVYLVAGPASPPPSPSGSSQRFVAVTTPDCLSSAAKLDAFALLVSVGDGKQQVPAVPRSFSLVLGSNEQPVIEVPSSQDPEVMCGGLQLEVPPGTEALQSAFSAAYNRNAAGVAAAAREAKHPADVLSPAFHYLLAACLGGTAPPSLLPCRHLVAYHAFAARVLLEASLLATGSSGDERAKAKRFVAACGRALLSVPLLPAASGEGEKSGKKKLSGASVPCHAILPTAVLSTISGHFEDVEVDALADLWGVQLLVEPKQDALHAVKQGKKHSPFLACLEAALVRRLAKEPLGVPVPQLLDELHWETLQPSYGAFNRFVQCCKNSFLADKRDGVFFLSAAAAEGQKCSVTVLPLSGRKAAETEAMTTAAVEELLTVLPRGTRHALLSSLGVSIYSWNRFNNRHGRLLGPSLHAFLLKHPEHFTVVGRSVRRTNPDTSPSFDPGLLRHGGRRTDDDDEGAKNQKKRKVGSRAARIHAVISDKYKRKMARKQNLRSAKIQKIPGFGRKKGKYKGKGTTPHYMK